MRNVFFLPLLLFAVLALTPAKEARASEACFDIFSSAPLADPAKTVAQSLAAVAQTQKMKLLDYLQTPAARKAVADAGRGDATFMARFKTAINLVQKEATEAMKRPDTLRSVVPQKILVRGNYEPVDIGHEFYENVDGVVELQSGHLIGSRRFFHVQTFEPDGRGGFRRLDHLPNHNNTYEFFRELDPERVVALYTLGNNQRVMIASKAAVMSHPMDFGSAKLSTASLNTLEESIRGRGAISDLKTLSNGHVFMWLTDGSFKVFNTNRLDTFGPSYSLARPGERGHVMDVIQLPNGDLLTAHRLYKAQGFGGPERHPVAEWPYDSRTGTFGPPRVLANWPEKVRAFALFEDGSVAAGTLDGSLHILARGPNSEWTERQRIDLDRGMIYEIAVLPDGKLIVNTRSGGMPIIELGGTGGHDIVQVLQGHPDNIQGGANAMKVLRDGRILTMESPMSDQKKVLVWSRALNEVAIATEADEAHDHR